jgi:hypothetical protein
MDLYLLYLYVSACVLRENLFYDTYCTYLDISAAVHCTVSPVRGGPAVLFASVKLVLNYYSKSYKYVQ